VQTKCPPRDTACIPTVRHGCTPFPPIIGVTVDNRVRTTCVLFQTHPNNTTDFASHAAKLTSPATCTCAPEHDTVLVGKHCSESIWGCLRLSVCIAILRTCSSFVRMYAHLLRAWERASPDRVRHTHAHFPPPGTVTHTHTHVHTHTEHTHTHTEHTEHRTERERERERERENTHTHTHTHTHRAHTLTRVLGHCFTCCCGCRSYQRAYNASVPVSAGSASQVALKRYIGYTRTASLCSARPCCGRHHRCKLFALHISQIRRTGS
jgi:hypothetical protein